MQHERATKDHIWYDPIYLKCPEKRKSSENISVPLGQGDYGTNGGSIWDEKMILNLDADDCTIL